MDEKRINILLAIACIVVFVSGVLTNIGRDNDLPTITIPEGEISYRVGEDTSMLLSDVTAFDQHDGDISAKVFINQLIISGNGREGLVVYAVTDSANHVAKAERRIKVITDTGAATPAEPGGPTLVISEDSAHITTGEAFDPFGYIVSITDDKDPEEVLLHHVSVEGTYDTTEPGSYILTIYVTDLDGNRSNMIEFLLDVD